MTAMASMNAEALLELPKLLSVMLKLLFEMPGMAPVVAYALLQPLELLPHPLELLPLEFAVVKV